MPTLGYAQRTIGLGTALTLATLLIACGSPGKKDMATGGGGGKGGGAGMGGGAGGQSGRGGKGGGAGAGQSAGAGQGGAAGSPNGGGGAGGSSGGAGGAGGLPAGTGGGGASGPGGGGAPGPGGGGGLGGAAGASPNGGAGGLAGTGGVAGAGGSPCIAPASEPPLVPSAAGVPATGLVLWLRADRGITKTVNQAVCSWSDQSGHGFVFGAGQTRPTWSPEALGDAPAVRFNGVGQSLATAGVLGLSPTGPRTIIAVSQLVGTSQRSALFMQGQSGTQGTYLGLDANTFNTTGKREGVYIMNNAYDAASTTGSEPRVHVLLLDTMTPGTAILPAVNYFINGGKQALTRTAGGLGNGNFENFQNANFTSVGGDANVILGEILVYDRLLTNEERIAAEVALEDRYTVP